MRIISGIYKGKEIPFRNQKFDDANITSQKVKKAVFSILGEDLTGRNFLDLYSCSGQIGLEALSRNAGFVVFNEIDNKRFKFIKSIIGGWRLEKNSMALNFHAFRCMRYLDSKGIKFDCIFIDAPYTFSTKDADQYKFTLDELAKYNIIKERGKIIIQHLSKIHLNGSNIKFIYKATNNFGKNSLSVFDHQ